MVQPYAPSLIHRVPSPRLVWYPLCDLKSAATRYIFATPRHHAYSNFRPPYCLLIAGGTIYFEEVHHSASIHHQGRQSMLFSSMRRP